MIKTVTIAKTHYDALKRRVAYGRTLSEVIIFDAVRDNGGKGIRARDLLKTLDSLSRK